MTTKKKSPKKTTPAVTAPAPHDGADPTREAFARLLQSLDDPVFQAQSLARNSEVFMTVHGANVVVHEIRNEVLQSALEEAYAEAGALARRLGHDPCDLLGCNHNHNDEREP